MTVRKIYILVFFFLVAIGCVSDSDKTRAVVQTAMFDHGCNDVKVISGPIDIDLGKRRFLEGFELDVCGAHKIYRTAAGDYYSYFDVTNWCHEADDRRHVK